MWQPAVKRYRWAFFAHTGNLAETSALSPDDFRVILAGAERSPSLPGEIAAALATLAFSEHSPNYNFDGAELPVYPAPKQDVWTDAEIEALLAAGVTPLVAAQGHPERSEVVKLVTSQVTLDGAPFYPLRDLATSKSAAFMAAQLDIALRRAFKAALFTDKLVGRIVDVVVQVLRQGERARVVRGVDSAIPEIRVQRDPAVSSRVNVRVPYTVVPPLHQIDVENIIAA
jgi:phage tail sheath gpL-like